MTKKMNRRKFQSINELLDFAINKESESIKIYNKIAARAEDNAIKVIFKRFAREEFDHMRRLTEIKEKNYMENESSTLLDLDVPSFSFKLKRKGNLSVKDALKLAVRREKAAFQLYSQMAEATENPTAKKLLTDLARDEAQHEMKISVENDTYLRNVA